MWASPRRIRGGERGLVYEYAPVNHGKRKLNLDRPLARMTAATPEAQAEVHERIGAPLPVQPA